MLSPAAVVVVGTAWLFVVVMTWALLWSLPHHH